MDEELSPTASSGQPSASDQVAPVPSEMFDATPRRAAVVRGVDAGSADQGVGPGSTDQRVVAAAAVEKVITPAAPDQIVPRPAVQLVITGRPSLADTRCGKPAPPVLPAEVVLPQDAQVPGIAGARTVQNSPPCLTSRRWPGP